MNLKYPIVLTSIEDEGEMLYSAAISEMPGLVVYAETANVALEDLQDAKEMWIENNLELGRVIKEPEVLEEEFSGRLTVRIPKSTHKNLVIQAKKEGISLNAYLNVIIERGTNGYTFIEALESVTERLYGKIHRLISRKKPEYHYHIHLEENTVDHNIYSNASIYNPTVVK